MAIDTLARIMNSLVLIILSGGFFYGARVIMNQLYDLHRNISHIDNMLHDICRKLKMNKEHQDESI